MSRSETLCLHDPRGQEVGADRPARAHHNRRRPSQNLLNRSSGSHQPGPCASPKHRSPCCMTGDNVSVHRPHRAVDRGCHRGRQGCRADRATHRGGGPLRCGSHDGDRTARVVDQRVAHRAQEQAGETASASRADYDELSGRGALDQDLRGSPSRHQPFHRNVGVLLGPSVMQSSLGAYLGQHLVESHRPGQRLTDGRPGLTARAAAT